MAMEETVNSIEDHLIEGPSFKLKATSNYVLSRKSNTYYPQGGNEYAPGGVRVIRIALTGSQGEWLDPATLAVTFKVNNISTVTGSLLRFLSGPWVVMKRIRVLCQGVVVEDLDSYSRCHELFHMLGSEAKRNNDSILGFHLNAVKHIYDLDRQEAMSRNAYDYTGISKSKQVVFTPLSGLCGCDKYLPLRYLGGLTLEFELVNTLEECIISEPWEFPAQEAREGVPAQPAFAAITAASISKEWSITEVAVLCDVIILDN